MAAFTGSPPYWRANLMRMLAAAYTKLIEGLALIGGLIIAGVCLLIIYDVVARNLGMGWGVVVFFFDAAKGVVPVILARLFLFNYDVPGFLALYAMGIAAIVGHCKPVLFKFRGGFKTFI